MSPEAPSVPPTMRAWTFNKAGAPSVVLSFKPSFPTPRSPTGSQLLVRISHTALSSAGLELMRSVPSLLRSDAIPEIDFSGRVVAAGPSASQKFPLGTPVFGTVAKGASVVSGVGVLAEYVLVDAGCVAVKPGRMSFAQAAGLSGLGQTALEMVLRGGIKKGDRVLVNGGSGGVGSVAVQLAKALGGYVVATCSGRNVEFVNGFGVVDEVIDYTRFTSLPDQLAEAYSTPPFDVILDTVGSQGLYKASPAFLKPEGPFVNVGTIDAGSQSGGVWRWVKNASLPAALGGVPRKYIMFSAPLSGKNAESLAKFVEEGKLRIVVDSTFALDDALKAYERSASKKASGKVIIRIGDLDNEQQHG